MTDAPNDPLIGRLLDGRYQVRSRIARGGMATVYLASDIRLERRVALKIMHSHLADDRTFTDRFIQEARSAARLSHPNVVNVYDQGQDHDLAYLVMEYLPGITLRELIRRRGKLNADETRDILINVLRGLSAAHRAGIIHRDMKPENVLLADDGRIKLGDFGLARAASSNTATGAALLGTIAYLSPELVTRGQADARSDIYALGIMAYEMLTGEQPYKGEQPMQIAYQHAHDSVPRPGIKVANVPEALDELVLWSTSRNPDDRPAQAGELLDFLLSSPSGTGPTSEPLQATMPLPPLAGAATGAGIAAATAATTVAFGAESGPTAEESVKVETTPAIATLERISKRRASRGWLAFLLVLVLAAAAAGTGWYFGTGPGSKVTVPTISNQSYASAKAQLEELGFSVKQELVNDLKVAEGLTLGTRPKGGMALDRGARVTVIVSAGPKPVTIPALANAAAEDARKQLSALGISITEPDEMLFNDDVERGHILSVTLGGDNPKDVTSGSEAHEGDQVAFVVSAGSVPELQGLTEDQAQTVLDAVGLKATAGAERYSDSVEKGRIIEWAKTGDGPLRPGDTLRLTLSRGPELFEVPNVVGQRKNSATTALKNSGFSVRYLYPEDWMDDEWIKTIPDKNTKVSAQDPAAGANKVKGTVITLTIQITFGFFG